MRLTDRLIRDTEKRQNMRRLPDDDDGEETMTYQERKPLISLNTASDVFDSQFNRGINSEKSIFDKTAVFRTGE